MKFRFSFKALLALAIAFAYGQPSDPSGLFGKDEKLNRLVIKSQIAYHFKKVVREVSQELFVSRKIDVSLLFLGVQVFNRTETEVRKLCNNLSHKKPSLNAAFIGSREDPFVLIEQPVFASFAEAKARCTALGMQLPEIYTNSQADDMTNFLEHINVDRCFAGIVPDITDAVQRHIATGFPLWKTGYARMVAPDGSNKGMMGFLDDANAKFMYTKNKTILVSHDEPVSLQYKEYADPGFRERPNNYKLPQLMSRIVCAHKWDGTKYWNVPDSVLKPVTIKVIERYTRSTRTNKNEDSGYHSLKTLCHSVADQAGESYREMYSKLTNLLALVDISVQTVQDERSLKEGGREKRFLFLAKFIFVTGVKLLWQLFGFVQKVKLNNRLKHLEAAILGSHSKIDQNTKTINKMTKLIYGNSVAIGQLSIRVDNIEVRLSLVESQVSVLQDNVGDLSYRFEASTSLSIIMNLLYRTKQSMDNGYDVLKDIVHTSKQGQTSPLVLPIDQIELVQREITKVSTAVLDPDFSRMQSIVVSDPNDPSLLLVIINVAALSRQSVEVVKMIPIPFFEKDGAYVPTLDYDTIVLDQSAHTFSIISEQEESECLLNRCYISSMEQSVLEKSCGIPQYFDRFTDHCQAEKAVSTGVFLKPMLPDGVVFAFEKEVQTQLFCRDNDQVGSPRRLKGTGILQLPNGCVLSVIDSNNKISKVKGQPRYRVISADDINLVSDGPLSVEQADGSSNGTSKAMTIDKFMEKHVSSIVQQMSDVDSKVETQYVYIWGIFGLISLILIISMMTVYCIYRYSSRFRSKMRMMRDAFAELTQQVLHIEVQSPPIVPRPRPIVPMRPIEIMRHRIRDKKIRAIQRLSRRKDPDEDPSYLDLDQVRIENEVVRYAPTSSFRPVSDAAGLSPRRYPRLTPDMVQLRLEAEEDERLREETEHMLELKTVIEKEIAPKKDEF